MVGAIMGDVKFGWVFPTVYYLMISQVFECRWAATLLKCVFCERSGKTCRFLACSGRLSALRNATRIFHFSGNS